MVGEMDQAKTSGKASSRHTPWPEEMELLTLKLSLFKFHQLSLLSPVAEDKTIPTELGD